MKRSKVMDTIKKELLSVQKRMTPAERVGAFVKHSKLLVSLFETGEKYRTGSNCRGIHATPSPRKRP